MKISAIDPIHIAVPYSYGGSSGTDPRWRTMDTCIIKVTTDEGIVAGARDLGSAPARRRGLRSPIWCRRSRSAAMRATSAA